MYLYLLYSLKSRTYSIDSVWRCRMLAWRREWLRKCSQLGRRRIPTATHFIASQLLPWWFKCNDCGKWRQLPPQTSIRSSEGLCRFDNFVCADIIKVCFKFCNAWFVYILSFYYIWLLIKKIIFDMIYWFVLIQLLKFYLLSN